MYIDTDTLSLDLQKKFPSAINSCHTQFPLFLGYCMCIINELLMNHCD